jgi:hypothetical protein
MMPNERLLQRFLILSIFASCLVATTGGCDASQGTEATQQGDSREIEPKIKYVTPAESICIIVSDNRTLSNVTVTLYAQDNATGIEYSDWEAVGGNLRGMTTSNGNHEDSVMYLFNRSSDALKETQYSNWMSTYSEIVIRPEPNWSSWLRTRVTVNARINGYCHEDYHDFYPNWAGSQTLYFNGAGAHWDGSCFRGDMLRTSP